MGLLEEELKKRSLPQILKSKNNGTVQDISSWISRREEIKSLL